MEQERNMYESEVHRKYTARMNRLDAVTGLLQLALELKEVIRTGYLVM